MNEVGWRPPVAWLWSWVLPFTHFSVSLLNICCKNNLANCSTSTTSNQNFIRSKIQVLQITTCRIVRPYRPCGKLFTKSFDSLDLESEGNKFRNWNLVVRDKHIMQRSLATGSILWKNFEHYRIYGQAICGTRVTIQHAP